MNHDFKTAGFGAAGLTCERSRTLLQQMALGEFDASDLAGIALEREAAAAFVADLATLATAVAESGGLANCKCIGELLYTQAFFDAAEESDKPAPTTEISAGQARLNR